MPVDTSIYNAFLQPQKSAIDYQNEYLGAQSQRQKIQQNAIGLQGAQASLADAQRVRDEQSGIRNALAALPATATPDDQVKALRSLGTPTALTQADTLATSYGKQQVDAATAREKTSIGAKNDNETAVSKHNQRLQALATVQSPEDAVQWALDGVKSGDIPAESLPIVLQKIGAAAQQPGGLERWLQRLAQAGQTVQQQREQSAPKPTEVRLGNVVKIIDTNGYSPTYGKEVTPALPIGESPDTAATNATTRRGQDMADKRAAAVMDQPEYKQGDDGTYYALPKKVAPGAQIAGQVVNGPDGKPLQGKATLTEGQGKATTFAARMQDAESTIQQLESKGVKGSDFRTIAAGNGLTNWLASDVGQQYRQAQENWVTANLRHESGAAIGKDEMAKDVRKFFASPGDSDAVIAQKDRARAVAIQGMLVQAGPGAKSVPGIVSNASAKPAAASADVPPDIQAIIDRHGKK